MSTPRAIAARLTDAIVRGDADTLAALYTPDAVCWRNFDDRTLTREQMFKIAAFLATRVSDLRYDDVRVTPTETGYVQQHTMRATAPNGTAVTVPTCLVVTLRDGLIARVDEYMDQGAVAPMMG